MAKKKSKEVVVTKGTHGGPGRGGGRKPGQATKLTRERANEISKSGESPLDVMLDNMLFWHRASQKMGERLAELSAKLGPHDDKVEFLKLLRTFLDSRTNAQACAVDLAPYVHPKLSSIAFTGDMNSKITIASSGMSAAEAAAAYATSLKGGLPDDAEEK